MSQRELFESLTRQHLKAMWRTAQRMSGNPEAADDLVQETCLRAFRSFGDYRVGTNYKAWIFRILTNLCRDRFRSESRSPMKEWDDAEVDRVTENYHCGISGPESELQSSELTTAMCSSLSALPPKIRVVVSLSLLGDFSYLEISRLLDIPVGTVRSRLSRGRVQLQRELITHIDGDVNENQSSPNYTISVSKDTLATDNVLRMFPETEKKNC